MILLADDLLDTLPIKQVEMKSCLPVPERKSRYFSYVTGQHFFQAQM